MSSESRNVPVSVSQFIYDKKVPQFAFLSKPPPPRRAGPNLPLPPTPPKSSPAFQATFCDRTNTTAYSSIIAWASLVQPGSPAPRSPQRRLSISSPRRPSFPRRPSISHGRAASGSLIHIVDTQKTPSVGDFDLTALGYTSVFIHLPKTPTTPSPYLRQRSAVEIPPSPPAPPPVSKLPTMYTHIPIPPIPSEQQQPTTKRTGFSRFRSLSILRPRSSKSKQQQQQQQQQPSTPPSPCSPATAPKPTKTNKHPAPPTETGSSLIAKRKRAKYAVPPPPSLANELALMQFLEGGNMDSHAKRVMEAQAQAAAGSGAGVGVGDVYRDGNGGIWWDADEEWEYTHLLADSGAATAPAGKTNIIDWEEFEATSPCYFSNLLSNKENDDPLGERRDSVSSQDSDLDLKYLVTVPEHTPSGFNAPVEDRVLASHKIGGPGMSILSLPCRPRRKALHLNKPDYLVDIAAFGPRSPKTATPATPLPISTTTTKPKPKGQARRRPAPLKLAHQAQNAVVVVRRPNQQVNNNKTSVENSMEKVRKEFIDDSFAPTAAVVPPALKSTTTAIGDVYTPSRPPPPQRIMNRKPSRMNVRGLFSVGRRD